MRVAVPCRPFFFYLLSLSLVGFKRVRLFTSLSRIPTTTHDLRPPARQVIRTAQSLGVSIEVLPWNCQYSWDGYKMHEYNQ